MRLVSIFFLAVFHLPKLSTHIYPKEMTKYMLIDYDCTLFTAPFLAVPNRGRVIQDI